ncbi:MAG: RagB/SusD family nutrient uptake outer membrane protein [Mangrovibacterium sp.]
MNKLKYILLLVILPLFFSCNDDFMDRYPETAITEGTFWNSEQDLKTYNNQLYAAYFADKGFGTGATMVTNENWSDNSFADVPSDARLGTNTANSPGRSDWDYSLIRNVNVFLANYQHTTIAEALQNKYAAEARLFRALNYYDKLKLYGKLPLIDRVLGEKDELLYATQSSRDVIMDFIMADLEFAVTWLPTTAETGRFTKYIAEAYKARICLHEGTFRKYHGLANSQTYIEAAAVAANVVIASNLYAIDVTTSYYSLFEMVNYNSNKEIVFFKNYDAALQMYNNLPTISGPFGSPVSGTKSLVNDYLCTDGLPITESPLYQGDDNITNEFANRDKRLSNTFGLPNTYFMGNQIYINSSPKPIGDSASPSGYQLVKFYNAVEDKTAAWAQAYHDAPLIRYAEILLTYAEAKKELGTLTQSDLDICINPLREKAGVADMQLAGATLAEIRRERRVELAFEGLRYDDLMRWKMGSLLAQPVIGLKFNATDIADYSSFVVGTNVYLDANGYIKSNNTYSFDESKNYYFPVPVNELSLNENLDQTDGWEE